MTVLGVDGCKSGWVAVVLEKETSRWEIDRADHIGELWDKWRTASLILVDMPIGLIDSAPSKRVCDAHCRRLLGFPRRNSVFPVPCRGAVYADRREASAINKARTDRWLTQQTLGIIPKIRELDNLLAADEAARRRILEVHPELCFWALNGGRAMEHRKKKLEGFRERLDVLQSVYPQAADIVVQAHHALRGLGVAKDDVVDALAAAVTALADPNELCSIPEKPQFDARGLAMQMVFRFVEKSSLIS